VKNGNPVLSVSILKQWEEEKYGESSRRNSISFCCGPYGYILSLDGVALIYKTKEMMHDEHCDLSCVHHVSTAYLQKCYVFLKMKFVTSNYDGSGLAW